MNTLLLRYTIAHESNAQDFQQRLMQRGQAVELCLVNELNARLFRQNPDLALCVDGDGLWLTGMGMKMQPDWPAEVARLKRASVKTEMLARACQLSEAPSLIDATAGLAHDALLLAALGAQVQLIERHPVVFTLLEDALQRAQLHDYLAKVVARIQLINADANCYLSDMAVQQQRVDVLYLDPMFPQRDQHSAAPKKQAQVKKQMQLLHALLPSNGEMDLGDALLPLAQRIAKRVIVKRPKHAVFLNQQQPDHQWLGDACRFDAYFQTFM